jgi:hypothetical protein
VAEAKTRPTKQCRRLHIKRLGDVDLAVLEKVVSASVKETRRRHR